MLLLAIIDNISCSGEIGKTQSRATTANCSQKLHRISSLVHGQTFQALLKGPILRPQPGITLMRGFVYWPPMVHDEQRHLGAVPTLQEGNGLN